MPHLGLYLAGRRISGHQTKQVLAFLGTWPLEEMGSGIASGSSWSSGACGTLESDWVELVSGHPPISVCLPIHPPVPFSPSTSLSICASICHLSAPPSSPSIRLLPSDASFSSPVIWAVITGLALALTLNSPWVRVHLPHYMVRPSRLPLHPIGVLRS